MPPLAAPPLVLTVAGFDPTAGAGVLADIKTLAANQCYGVACVSALTVQNTRGVRAFEPVSAKLLEEQLECLLGDVAPRATKLGMMGGKAVIEAVARQIERHALPLVVLDPIRAASSGTGLGDEAAWKHLRERLLPLATVLTPNLAEAAALTGLRVTNLAEMEAAAAALHGSMGTQPHWVIVKGGHLEDRPVDVLFDGSQATPLAADRVRTEHAHGTGCTFSAAVAANLALGKQMLDAAVQAKAYVGAALRQAYGIGGGAGPLNHLYRLQEASPSRNVDPAPQHEFTTR